MHLVLSTAGKVNKWIVASETALGEMEFYDIQWNDQTRVLYANFDQTDYIEIAFSERGDGRTQLDINASSREIIALYQHGVKEVLIGPSPDARTKRQMMKMKADTREYPAEMTQEVTEESLETEALDEERRFVIPQALNKAWIILLAFIVVPPAGIFLLFYFHRATLGRRIVLTVIGLAYTLFIWVGFFGVNTGVNKGVVDGFIEQKRWEITRFWEERTKPNIPMPTPTTATDSEGNTIIPDVDEDVEDAEADF